jgi:hypothetical protein
MNNEFRQERKELIDCVDKRFQFVMILIVFLPIALQALFGLSNPPSDQYNKLILGYGLAIFLFALSYIFIELLKEKVAILALKLTNWILLISVMLTAVIFYLLSMLSQDKLPTYLTYYPNLIGCVYIGCITSLFVVPALICTVLIVGRLNPTKK